MFAALISSLFKEGAFVVRLPDNSILSIGGATEAEASLIVHIRNNTALRRIALAPQLAAGEAYMDGGLVIERGTLYDLLALASRNRRRVRKRRPPTLLRASQENDRGTARRNVAHHYDLSGDLYRLFLDADQQYSCAYFPRPGMTLEEAQAAKKQHLAAKLLLSPGQRVLDIGSGWGGLAITLAEDYAVDVTGATLSEEQLSESRRRAAERGLQRRVRFELKDYRDIEGRFDRIVSVGMFEHVGPAHYQTFFDTIAQRLDDKGVAVLHTIGDLAGPAKNNPWIDRYIFPGGEIPALSQIIPAVERAGLVLTDIEVLRMHYAETLRAWRERFAARRDEAQALYDERFCRMWEFYLAGAEAGFREGSLAVFQLQMAKNQSAVPLTRDYIADLDRSSRLFAIAAE